MRSVAAFLLVSLSMVALVPSASAATQVEALDRPYLEGYFRYVDGVYRLSWEPALPTTEAPIPPTSPNCGSIIQPCPPKGPPQYIETDPLPRDVTLNASRFMRLDLYTSGSGLSCQAKRDVIIRRGPDFVGGSGGLQNSDALPAVVGWCAVGLRISPELFQLKEGDRLVFQVQDVTPNFRGIGTVPPHQSTFMMPLFTADELLERFPVELTKPGMGGSDPSAESSTGLGIGLALLGLAALRPRGGAVRMAALLLAVAFAGCAGTPEKRADVFGGEIRVTGGTTESTSSGASLVGIVRSPEGAPLAGALAVVPEFGVAEFSNGQGRFRFANLTPGEVHLRVELKGYLVAQEGFRLEVGENLAEVRLARDEAFSALGPIHKHPTWGDRDSVLIADFEVGAFTCALVPTTLEKTCGAILVGLPSIGPETSEAHVFPGTILMEVTLDWEPAETSPAFKRVNLGFRSPEDPGNTTYLYPRGRGETYRIPTTWEMTDVGHSLYSQWPFTVYPLLNETTPVEHAQDVALARPWGPMQMKVRIHRGGALPFEPPHPDHWGGASTLPIGSVDFTPRTPQCTTAAGAACVPSDCLTYGDVLAGGCFPATYNTSVPLPVKGFLVPHDTTRLRLELRSNRAPTLPFEWQLVIKDASSPQLGCPMNEPGQPRLYALPAPEQPKANTVAWTIDLLAGPRADPAYAKVGSWCFWVRPSDPNNYFLDYCATSDWCVGIDPYPYNRYPIFLHLDVVALK